MSCDGSGILDCYCGGDHCACGCPPACPGCVECAPEPDPEVRVAQLEAELESVRGLDLPGHTGHAIRARPVDALRDAQYDGRREAESVARVRAGRALV